MGEYYRYYFFARKDEMRYPVSAQSQIGHADDLFSLLSTNTLSLDAYKRIHQSLPNIPFSQSFQSAAKAFRVIDSLTRGVIVPYQAEGEEIVAKLCSVTLLEKQYKLLRQAQRYSVNLFSHQFNNLADTQAIYEVQPDSGVFALRPDNYDENLGWKEEDLNKLDLLEL